MENVAVLVDGGFYLRRAKHLWGERSAQESAEELHTYCIKHTWNKRPPNDRLYRIFYYDCPPSRQRIHNPYTKTTIDLSKTDLFTWMSVFHEELRTKRKVALRLGELSPVGSGYMLKPDAIRDLMNGTIEISEIKEEHFSLHVEQKGVDMRIGLDISSMAYKRQVTKIVLIAGDSDFVPAAKLARREGVDFVLDPMGAKIKPSLSEHIDGIRSHNITPDH